VLAVEASFSSPVLSSSILAVLGLADPSQVDILKVVSLPVSTVQEPAR